MVYSLVCEKASNLQALFQWKKILEFIHMHALFKIYVKPLNMSLYSKHVLLCILRCVKCIL